ncbi:hypothetical protein [Alicyclobacillus mengziensis]|uniref:Uncharacterized protein n=1 Tax=Alicyclobacillus mengziensis TaxID=2931921 RepID=A0A9X7Z6X7_9BACL|nr:hypothetical protein [Alicyclobacillus mengziensis]QSO48409.1 hypothetical protein JZ786_05320 [Alicyclobacillus mengziensis]
MQNVFSQSKFEVSFCESGREWKAFQQFPMDTMQEDHETYCDLKVQQMVHMLSETYQFTKRELKNFFTVNEAQFIVGTFISTLYDPSFSAKELLIAHVEDGSHFDGLDEMFDVDVHAFINKLHRLTEFQAFTLIRMAYEYLHTYGREELELQMRGGELVAKVFGIEEAFATV